MNILFLTLVRIDTILERGIYTDLLRQFVKEGDQVYVASPVERREGLKTHIKFDNGVKVLRIKTLNVTKTNLIEKGLGTYLIEDQFCNAVKRYFNDVKFDLILYSTPPITFSKTVDFIKKRDGAYSYLLLKDIFPQNAVDMGMMRKGGVLHHFFVKKEKTLYQSSDFIGCMSAANKDYLLSNNTYLEERIVEVNPNSIEPNFLEISDKDKTRIKNEYNLPLDKKIFVYGGNLGKPQGVGFLLDVVRNCLNPDAFFLIVGNGTEFQRIKKAIDSDGLKNVLLLSSLPKNEYDNLLRVCDVGMIFLSEKFSIPNFPSRLLSYLENKMPVISATDLSTDIGVEIERHGSGYGITTGELQLFLDKINELSKQDSTVSEMGQKAWEWLNREYTVGHTSQLIKEKVIYAR